MFAATNKSVLCSWCSHGSRRRSEIAAGCTPFGKLLEKVIASESGNK